MLNYSYVFTLNTHCTLVDALSEKSNYHSVWLSEMWNSRKSVFPNTCTKTLLSIEGGTKRGVSMEGGTKRGVSMEEGTKRGVSMEGGTKRGVSKEGMK